MLLWLPFDDWADHVDVPAAFEVEVWRSGLRVPRTVDRVEVYVPEYMGPPSTVEVLARMSGLRLVQTLTAGYDDVLPWLPSGVTLCNARGVHDASTAELAVGLALASLRGLPEFVRAQDRGAWTHESRRALADSRVLLVGYGSVGRAVAARLAPFEVDLVVVARTARVDDGVAVHPLDRLPELLPTADVVVLAVPLTPQTSGLAGAAFLAAMADGALLVNVARGPVVDTGALLAELTSGRLRAALDVTDPEPLPPDHPLWQAPNLLVSPHVGGDTTAFLPRAHRLLSAQLARLAAGRPPVNVVAGR